jgi:hypothetical protein
MLLGALADAGVPVEVLGAPLERLDLGIALRPEAVTRASLGATRMHVEVPVTETVRHLPDVVELLGPVDDAVRTLAVRVFERLADAEAAVHRVGRDEVHFHEVGALDSIADVVAVCAGVHHLRSERGMAELWCSTLSLGSGSTRGAHGPIPVPAPAVLELLTGVAPVAAGPAPFESTTPTGAALLVELVDSWGPMPAMTVTATTGASGMASSTQVTATATTASAWARSLCQRGRDRP